MITTTIGIGVILIMIDTAIIGHIILTILTKQEIKMYYWNYRPYPYYRGYYNPYNYRRYYYNPYYYNNIIDSNIANVDQNITNFGDMSDVIQDSVIYQSLTPPNPGA